MNGADKNECGTLLDPEKYDQRKVLGREAKREKGQQRGGGGSEKGNRAREERQVEEGGKRLETDHNGRKETRGQGTEVGACG